MTEFEEFCRAETPRRGITPDVAVWVANREGSLTEPARRGTFATGSSWWAYQLHYGGLDPERFGERRRDYRHLGTTAGMGNSFTYLTGWEPGDPHAWRDAMRYALDEARRGGWGPWYGAKAIGITGFYGIDRAVPWGGTPAEEWDYQKRGPTVPDAPLYAFPVEGYPKGTIPLHWGQSPNAADLFAPRGTPVRAMVSGTIADASLNPLGGWSVYLIGDAETKSLHYYLAHLNERPLVVIGQRVTVGQRLGSVGDSGNAQGKGTHLHIGIGTTIKDGSGPEGGAGEPWPGNNCNRYLQRVLDAFGSGPTEAPPPPPPPPDPRDAEIAHLKRLLDEANTKLGVLTVNHADALAREIEALKTQTLALGERIVALEPLLLAIRALRPPP